MLQPQMRLLKLEANGEFSLTNDIAYPTTPYAILSHTWGEDDEEVTFEDLKDGSGKTKKGYKKLRFCGELAARHGLQYFWVDTCCINKSRDSELSEAINSMFRWYRKAAKCYAYLTDVSTNDQIDLSLQPWEATFGNSRWFTRGWTLQELIAPLSVEFFCSNSNRLGDKKSLERQLHQITGIPVSVLQGNSLSDFSFDERVLWTRNRDTKREEDLAYSLLGIFDISIPVIYGEGKENAFRRLNREWKYRLNELSQAGTAVAYAKEILSVIPAVEAAKQRTVDDSMDVSSKRHLETALTDLAREKNVNLNWRVSIVDLLKLLGLPSDLFTRELLADRLRIHNGPTGSAKQNEALYKAVMKELAANEGRVLPKIRECDTCGELGHFALNCPNRELAKTQEAAHTAPELPGSRRLNEMQVAEPTFPLAQPPICLQCGFLGKRVMVRLGNPIGNAGRPYYRCSPGIHESHVFITFDDNIGIIPDNPRCNCGYISRLSMGRNRDYEFYSCPVGSCRFVWNGLLLPPRAMPMQMGANGMRMNISGSSAETELTRPSSTPADISSFLVTELTDLLYEDNALNTLLSVALNDKSIREDKLQHNFHRILIQYGRNLKDEAESEEHLAAASFVRRRSSLVSSNICQRVAGRLDSRFKSLEESVERMEMLDKFDRLLKELGNAPEETTMTPAWDEEVVDDIGMLYPYYESLTELSRVKQFLVSGKAFAVLRESLRDFINPSFQTRLIELIDKYWRLENKDDRFRPDGDQHSLIAELLDTDPSCIGWTGRDRTSWSDILKWKFEGWTREKWDWWPFKPPQRRLRPGEARLHWTCECGEQRWAEVPTDFARAVTRTARTCLTDNQLVAYPSSVQPPQTSHLKQLPSSASVASSKAAESFAKGAQAAGGSGSSSRNHPLGAGPNTNTGITSSPLTSQRVFLLVAAGNGFRLAQIRVERLTTYDFFRELRQRYNDIRRFFRRWLSIWVYSHCDFYRCDKYEAHRYEPRREEFPDRKYHQEYQYEPNPMNLIPPIGPHEFYDRFHACYNPRSAFHFLHKCASFNKRTRDLLQLFPKSNSDLVEDSDKREPFWGIVARERPSIARLLLYNLACALPCLIFFFMWLFSWGHGGDLQNASVPLSVMLAALSVFWSIFFANLEFKQGNAEAGYRPS